MKILKSIIRVFAASVNAVNAPFQAVVGGGGVLKKRAPNARFVGVCGGVLFALAAIAPAFAQSAGCELCGPAASGNIAEVNLLIVNGADVNAVTSDGFDNTPLQLAALNGHLEVVNALIAADADLEAASSDGSRPLHFAVFKGALDIVNALIAAGADVNAIAHLVSSGGRTPWEIAVRDGHAEIVVVLEAAILATCTAEETVVDGVCKGITPGNGLGGTAAFPAPAPAVLLGDNPTLFEFTLAGPPPLSFRFLHAFDTEGVYEFTDDSVNPRLFYADIVERNDGEIRAYIRVRPQLWNRNVFGLTEYFRFFIGNGDGQEAYTDRLIAVPSP